MRGICGGDEGGVGVRQRGGELAGPATRSRSDWTLRFRATTRKKRGGRGGGARSASGRRSRGDVRGRTCGYSFPPAGGYWGYWPYCWDMLVATSPRANSSHVRVDDETIFTAASRDEPPGRGPRAERPRAMDERSEIDRAPLGGRARRTRRGTRRGRRAPRARWNAMSWRFSSPITRLSKAGRANAIIISGRASCRGLFRLGRISRKIVRHGESVALHQCVPSQGTRGSGRSNDLRSSH